MPTKTPKIKTSTKNEKPKPRLTWAQIAFGIFAVLLIISMILSSVTTNS